MMKFYAILLFQALLAYTYACDFDGCQNPDFGSCGNACCRLNIKIFGENTEEVMNKLNATLVQGGPDKLYIPQITADGDLTFRDLRPKDIPVDFVGQTLHTTANLMYNDTIDISLAPNTDDSQSTDVFAFSLSLIGGAWGDSGQNYYNILQLFDSIRWTNGYELSNADAFSCQTSVAGKQE